MNQHQSRRVAMQAIFLADQNPTLSAAQVEEKISSMLELRDFSAYAKYLIKGVLEHHSQLEDELAQHLKKGWSLTRVNPILVAILEVAVYEIRESQAIDAKAAINEALNLCDEFAEPKDKAFVNGILANFVKD